LDPLLPRLRLRLMCTNLLFINSNLYS
jgi:hypothetical protein